MYLWQLFLPIVTTANAERWGILTDMVLSEVNSTQNGKLENQKDKKRPGQTQSWRRPCPWSRRSTRRRQPRSSSRREEGRGGPTYPAIHIYHVSNLVCIFLRKISDLNITQVKVVHDIGHENLFEEGDIGVVLALEERVTPGLVLIEQLN